MSAPGDNVSGGTLSGRELAGYRLLHVLGTGGASEVYLAQRLDDPSALVAIKVLMPSWHLPPGERTAFYARFVREAQAAQRLSHRHILPVLGFGEDGDTTYMVLPFMAGGTLVTQLANAPRGLPLAQAAADLAQIADALDYAHAQGVVHRDIKPTNVLVDEKGQLYLADFGIARLFDPGEGGSAKAGSQPLTTLTVTGQVLGTPIYMAPEQLLSARVGPEADLYALGVLLYQLVTGAVPFQAETPLGLAMQHVQEPPPPPRLRRGDLPEPAEAAMLRALAKAPQERFASAGAFARAFTAGLRGQWSEGLFPGAHSSATPSTVVATPPPTIVATPPPTPYSASPYRSGPYSAPVYPQTYAATPPSYALPTRPRSSTMPVILTIVAVIAVIALVFSAQAAGMLHLGGASSGGNSTPSQSLTPGSASAANPPTPLVPVGQMLYYTAAAGPCDTNGASWAQNNQASESCQSGAFVMSAPECDCAIGVAALSSLPGKSLPDSYVVQVSAENVGNISSAKFGFKFRQQSVQDSGDGRGGYSFLVDPSGQWQFNRYDANGKRNIVDQEQLPAPVQGANTLDLVVSGATYSFYMGGHVITTQTDSNYASGFFCLAIEPGATVYFRDLAMYARQ